MHMVIRHSGVRGTAGYCRGRAPAIDLEGSPNVPGTAWYRAALVQGAAVGTYYADERQVAADALRAAGLGEAEVAEAVAAADAYFMGHLGLTMTTLVRAPGLRWRHQRVGQA